MVAPVYLLIPDRLSAAGSGAGRPPALGHGTSSHAPKWVILHTISLNQKRGRTGEHFGFRSGENSEIWEKKLWPICLEENQPTNHLRENENIGFCCFWG